MDRIELNRRIMQLNSKLNLYPWRFESGGSVAICETTPLRSFGFKVQLVLAILYAVYVDIKLLRAVLAGLDDARYTKFGIHLARALLGTTLSYWAYKFFVEHGTEHEMLYNFTQQSPGNFFNVVFRFRHYCPAFSSFIALFYNGAQICHVDSSTR